VTGISGNDDEILDKITPHNENEIYEFESFMNSI
jgi:hypothetical protein